MVVTFHKNEGNLNDSFFFSENKSVEKYKLSLVQLILSCFSFILISVTFYCNSEVLIFLMQN